MAGVFGQTGKSYIVGSLSGSDIRDWSSMVMGLGSVAGVFDENVTLADLGELAGGSYARQLISAQGWAADISSDTFTIMAATPPGFPLDLMGPDVFVRNVFFADPINDAILWFIMLDERAVDPVSDTVTVTLLLGSNTLPLP